MALLTYLDQPQKHLPMNYFDKRKHFNKSSSSSASVLGDTVRCIALELPHSAFTCTLRSKDSSGQGSISKLMWHIILINWLSYALWYKKWEKKIKLCPQAKYNTFWGFLNPIFIAQLFQDYIFPPVSPP